jgi:anti-sigma B factor antagonist
MTQSPQGIPGSSVPEFGLITRRIGDTVVVGLRGELCMRTAPKLAQRLEELLDGGGSDRAEIILDLRSLSFMDSSGVRLLIEADDRAQAGNHRFGIALEDAQPARVLEMVGLTDRPQRVPIEEIPSL